jgi:hypothetical protein
MVPVDDKSVISACRILFGRELAVTPDFLRALEPGSVKRAFRRRALETHPDRFAACDPLFVSQQTVKFVQVTDAYRQLNNFITEREQTHRNPFVRTEQNSFWQRKPEPRMWRPKQAQFYCGKIPRRNLLFGEYLYYTGSISQHVLVEAISWQRGLRPRFGDIALRWKLLSPAALGDILTNRRFGEPLGESALRLGALNRFQVNAVLFFQRKTQSPIGEYFITNGHIMQITLQRLLNEHRKHNEHFGSLCSFRNAN